MLPLADDIDIALCGGDCSGPGGCGGASCNCTGPAEDSPTAAHAMWAGWTQHWREVAEMLNALIVVTFETAPNLDAPSRTSPEITSTIPTLQD